MKRSIVVFVSLVALIIGGYCYLFLSIATKPEQLDDVIAHDGKRKELDIAVVSNFNLNPASGQIYGEHLRRGINICINEYEKSANEDEIQIEIKYFDYGSNLSDAVRIAQEIALCDSFDCVIGYNYSSYALAVADIFEKNSLPLVTIATASNLQEYKYVLQVGNNNTGMAKKIGDLGHQRQGVKLILVDEFSDYSLDLTNEIVDYFSILGDSIRSVFVNQDIKENDFARIYEEICKEDVGVVIIPTHEVMAQKLLESSLYRLSNKLLIGGDGWGSNGRWIKDILLDNNSNELLCVSHWHPSINPSFADRFLKYQDDGHTATDNAALGYDAMKIILEAYRISERNESIQNISSALKSDLSYSSSMGKTYIAGEREFVILDASSYPFKLKKDS